MSELGFSTDKFTLMKVSLKIEFSIIISIYKHIMYLIFFNALSSKGHLFPLPFKRRVVQSHFPFRCPW